MIKDEIVNNTTVNNVTNVTKNYYGDRAGHGYPRELTEDEKKLQLEQMRMMKRVVLIIGVLMAVSIIASFIFMSRW